MKLNSKRSYDTRDVCLLMRSSREEKWRYKKSKKGGTSEEKWWVIFESVHDLEVLSERRPPNCRGPKCL
jgi:hypothetical protein